MFFRAGFKRNMYYWEFIIMGRKFSILILAAFLRDDVERALYVIIPVISISCALDLYVRPYNKSKLNMLEICSLNVSFLAYYSAIFYLKTISGQLKFFFLIIIFILNVFFVALWIKHYIIAIRHHLTKVTNLFSNLSSNSKRSNNNTPVPKKNLLFKESTLKAL